MAPGSKPVFPKAFLVDNQQLANHYLGIARGARMELKDFIKTTVQSIIDATNELGV